MSSPASAELRLEAAVRLQLAPLSPRARARLVAARDGSLEALASARGVELAAAGVPRDAADAWDACPRESAQREIEKARRSGVALATRDSPAWPRGFADLEDAPAALWLRGALPDPALLPLAIVGTRAPTAYGLAATRLVAGALADVGALVVSGGARGVDGAAHEAALERARPTVAVLGCGVDVPYPARHARLFARIAECGAVVSEHPLGTEPRAHHFPVRNRLLAAWSRLVIVVEASLRSGTLITARLALDLGRDVLAVPGSIFSARSEGTNELLARGARPCRGAPDVLEELRPDERAALAPVAAPADEDDPVLALLPRGEAVELEAAAGLARLSAPELLVLLTEWEAAGRVRRLPGGLVVRA